MGKLIHYQEYSLPSRIRFDHSQLKALSNVIYSVEVPDMDGLEYKALREIARKLYLKLQQRITFVRKSYSMTFTDLEMWCLYNIIVHLPEISYEWSALHELITMLHKRNLLK